jgi:hypothetical protein
VATTRDRAKDPIHPLRHLMILELTRLLVIPVVVGVGVRGSVHIVHLSMRVVDRIVRFVDCRLVDKVD